MPSTASRPARDVLDTWNGEAVPLDAVPVHPVERLRSVVADTVRRGGRLVSLFGRTEGDDVLVTAVLADDPEGRLGLLSAKVRGGYPAISAEVPAAQAFERELAEQWGLRPEGHP
ncbi:MAG TPA: hydrogenase, partial [Anaeromyxobacteraceae bacterium]|nr:hydrogenase [Anaeromyxobacteraceae bacterium]